MLLAAAMKTKVILCFKKTKVILCFKETNIFILFISETGFYDDSELLY